MQTRLLFSISGIVLAAFFWGCGSSSENNSQPKGGAAQTETSVGAEHGTHGHEGEENVVSLPVDVAQKIGLSLDTVRLGRIERTIELPGEVVPDGDHVVHIVPRFPGIIKKAHKNIGDYVQAGEVLATIESNESLSLYEVVAYGSGKVIEKHATVGEFVTEERDLFVIADLSDVWVNIAIYGKDAPEIAVGQAVRIEALGGKAKTEAVVSYISPVFDERTRSLVARAVIPNSNNLWKPGTFIKASFVLTAAEPSLMVCKEARRWRRIPSSPSINWHPRSQSHGDSLRFI
ncbi:MAG: efflux RND transporter periplasmic adaptor subunit [candidate division Zixibacteria bacterium]|nr:efflux RND transporter periplasmic adaptor subunit [candidate division Zixibacteria bacterium]